MTEIFDHREQARSLRRQLNDHHVDIALLAQEAATVFRAVGMAPQVRWLELERNGYSSAEARSLHEVLAIRSDERLVVHVKSYRIQPGLTLEGVAFHHFFVEPIAELVRAQMTVRGFGQRIGNRLRLDFVRGGPAPEGTFDPDVFSRILLGLRAVLHLQLASVAQ
jgi:hypothetical protein